MGSGRSTHPSLFRPADTVDVVRSRGLKLALPALLIALLLPVNARAAEIVKDGSFESTPASEDNPNWEQGGIVFLPLCDSTCTEGGTGGGTVGPRTGSNWAWFGGNSGPEEQFVSQPVTIPPGTATLTFYLWLGASSGNGFDAFRVFMDDEPEPLFEVLESSTEYDPYKLATVDVSAYAGVGGPHSLSFEYAGFGPLPTNFSLDDISLQAGQSGTAAVSLKGPKKVTQGKKAKLKVAVTPCAGHAGEMIDLFRGKKKIASAMATSACTATFKVRIQRTSKFKAVSPAGASNTLKVRVRR